MIRTNPSTCSPCGGWTLTRGPETASEAAGSEVQRRKNHHPVKGGHRPRSFSAPTSARVDALCMQEIPCHWSFVRRLQGCEDMTIQVFVFTRGDCSECTTTLFPQLEKTPFEALQIMSNSHDVRHLFGTRHVISCIITTDCHRRASRPSTRRGVGILFFQPFSSSESPTHHSPQLRGTEPDQPMPRGRSLPRSPVAVIEECLLHPKPEESPPPQYYIVVPQSNPLLVNPLPDARTFVEPRPVDFGRCFRWRNGGSFKHRMASTEHRTCMESMVRMGSYEKKGICILVRS